MIFWLLALSACIYAAAAGGKDGRWATALIILASIATIPASRIGARFGQLETAVFGVDLALFAGLYILMLTSRRWFPVWMAGFHLIAVLTHLATRFAPDFTAKAYFAVESFWAIPVIISMAVGVALDRRAGIHRAAERAARERPGSP